MLTSLEHRTPAVPPADGLLLPRLPRALRPLAALVAALVLAAGAAPAAATEPSGLSVSVTGDVEEVSPESTVNYHAVVQSTAAAAADVRLVLSLPGFATITEAAGAEVGASTTSWTVTLDPGVPLELDVEAQIGVIPADELWSAARFDVFGVDGAAAIVGASDIVPVAGTEAARLKAAAEVESTLARLAAERSAEPGGAGDGPALRDMLLTGGALLVVLLAAASLIFARRARRLSKAADAAGAAVRGPGTVAADTAEPTRRSRREGQRP